MGRGLFILFPVATLDAGTGRQLPGATFAREEGKGGRGHCTSVILRKGCKKRQTGKMWVWYDDENNFGRIQCYSRKRIVLFHHHHLVTKV